MNRSDLPQLIEAALTAGQTTYARQAAQQYLADVPGDLEIQILLARALAAEGEHRPAAGVLHAVVAADPEDYATQRRLGNELRALGDAQAAAQAYLCAHLVDGLGAAEPIPDWVTACRAAYLADRVGDWVTALREAEGALRDDVSLPLPSLIYLAALWHAGKLDLARPLAEGFHSRWPAVVAFKLCLAECLLASGEASDFPSGRAITLIHDAAAQDAAGRVVARHWGTAHPYRSLWEGIGAVALPGPLPAEVTSLLGQNRLPAPPGWSDAPAAHRGSASARVATAAEALAEIQSQLDAVASRLPSKETLKHRLRQLTRATPTAQKTSPQRKAFATAATRGSPPADTEHYVLLSSRTRLAQVFGTEGFGRIDAALHYLARTAQQRSGMRARVLYVDDAAALSPLGLRPANPSNAWEIKTLVGKLAARLRAQQATIGALVIVGGPDIIPFHHLPNPTDDSDPDIPSDNPYATADENYFVPEWPIGRLPSGTGGAPGPLLRLLHIAAGMPAALPFSAPAPYRWLEWLRHWLRHQWIQRSARPSFGYSANVWKDASTAVYRLIGDPRELLTSPPIDTNALPVDGLQPARLSYFNLHGIEDGPEWYGQRSVGDGALMPEYPIALQPDDVANSGRAPVVVFSEACFGANIHDKSAENALCLRFLDSGTRALVGSTKIAYGSVTTPLIGADLLGHYFWQNLNLGLPAGEALRRAKLQMAQEMHARQGFLDGEDQKTLISFVLYGDPLVRAPLRPAASSGNGHSPKRAAFKSPETLTTVCDKVVDPRRAEGDQDELSPEMVAQIKTVVARYLPGMQDAALRVSHAHAQCAGRHHSCPTAQLTKMGKARPSPHEPRTIVVTLAKTFMDKAHAHAHYARVTLNETGAVVKLAMSR